MLDLRVLAKGQHIRIVGLRKGVEARQKMYEQKVGNVEHQADFGVQVFGALVEIQRAKDEVLRSKTYIWHAIRNGHAESLTGPRQRMTRKERTSYIPRPLGSNRTR